jgi:carotenoid cleavage dioxygenase-like enzyme
MINTHVALSHSHRAARVSKPAELTNVNVTAMPHDFSMVSHDVVIIKMHVRLMERLADMNDEEMHWHF